VQKVDLPTETLVARAFPRIDYADAYRMRLPNGVPNDLDAVVRAALGAAPRWVALQIANCRLHYVMLDS
jgi:hypothetical protein